MDEAQRALLMEGGDDVNVTLQALGRGGQWQGFRTDGAQAVKRRTSCGSRGGALPCVPGRLQAAGPFQSGTGGTDGRYTLSR